LEFLIFNKLERIQPEETHESTNWTYVQNLLADGSNTGYVTSSRTLERLQHFAGKTKETFKSTVLDEKIITNYRGFAFDISEHIFKSFNQRIVQMFETGISKHLVESMTPLPKEIEPPNGPVKLTFNHIGIWFYIWAICLTFGLSFFFIEFLASKVQKCIHKKLTSFLTQNTRLYGNTTKRLVVKKEIKTCDNQKTSQKKRLVETKTTKKPKAKVQFLI
jgi:hypothetical protein